MNSYFIQSLNSLNIHKVFVDPKSGQSANWVMVIQAYDPATASVSIVTQSLLNQRIDINIKPNVNGYYELTLDDTEPNLNFAHELKIKASEPGYDFGSNDAGDPMMVIIGSVDMTAYMEGAWYEFPIEQTSLGLKINDNAGDGTFSHEISYGVMP